MSQNLIQRMEQLQERLGNRLFRPNEDLFEKHSRESRFKERYGSPLIPAFIPGGVLYKIIRIDIPDPAISKLDKLKLIGAISAIEAGRVAVLYGVYRFLEYYFTR